MVEQAPDRVPLRIVDATLASLRPLLVKVLQWRLPDLADSEIGVVFLQGPDALKALANLKTIPAFPFFAVSVTGVSRNQAEGYNQAALQNRGIRGPLMDTRNEIAKFHLTPLLLTCNIAFMSNNMDHVLAAALSWMELGDTLEPEVSLLDPEYSFPIRMMGGLDVPFAESKNDDNQSYPMTFTVTIQTYTGWMELVPTVRTVSTNLIATGRLPQFDLESKNPDYWRYRPDADKSLVTTFKWSVRDKKRV